MEEGGGGGKEGWVESKERECAEKMERMGEAMKSEECIGGIRDDGIEEEAEGREMGQFAEVAECRDDAATQSLRE